MNNNRKVLDVVPSCGCDKIMPLALVYMFYVILHGHLSPGGGFQGGVLAVAVVAFMYLGHGYQTTVKALSWEFMHKTEGVASILYIVVAMIGVVLGAQFCQNFDFQRGAIGDLFSTGTIFYMDSIVGLKVLTGVGVLALSMFGLVQAEDGKGDKE